MSVGTVGKSNGAFVFVEQSYARTYFQIFWEKDGVGAIPAQNIRCGQKRADVF